MRPAELLTPHDPTHFERILEHRIADGFQAAVQAQQALVPAQSEVAFTSRQMGVPVDGKFTRFDAQVAFDPKKPEAAGELEWRAVVGKEPDDPVGEKRAATAVETAAGGVVFEAAAVDAVFEQNFG